MVAEALDKAWGTYARINKLDDARPDATVAPVGVFKFMTTLGEVE